MCMYIAVVVSVLYSSSIGLLDPLRDTIRRFLSVSTLKNLTKIFKVESVRRFQLLLKLHYRLVIVYH